MRDDISYFAQENCVAGTERMRLRLKLAGRIRSLFAANEKKIQLEIAIIKTNRKQ